MFCGIDRVNGHRKQQIELYREPTNTVCFSNYIDPHLTYNKRCMAVLTGAPRTAGENAFYTTLQDLQAIL